MRYLHLQQMRHFNPRPRKEGDSNCICLSALDSYFNPRPRKEGDQPYLQALLRSLPISIHALVKRATGVLLLEKTTARNFNPRPRKEGDTQNKPEIRITYYFNPRPRKEGDYKIKFIAKKENNFNPRPRKEGDYNSIALYIYNFKFQSTPS